MLAVIYLWPVLVVVGVIAAVVIAFIRHRRKTHPKPAAHPNPAAPAKPAEYGPKADEAPKPKY